mgnify:FL=1
MNSVIKKTSYLLFILVFITLCIPPYKAQYIAPVKPQNAPRIEQRAKTRVYTAPTGKALEIAKMVSRETNIPLDTISRIIWAESGYNPNAEHLNKNGTTDHGYFQINDIHIPEAKSMGLNINNPYDNARFAIYLIKPQGLIPWTASKAKWYN